MKSFVKIAGAVMIALGLTSAAQADTRVGVLRCQIQGGAGYIIGSSHKARCFYRGDDGRRERYAGRLSKLGVDLGVTHNNILIWAVFAPASLRRHALAGNYVGAQAGAAFGIGGGANVLVGGGRNSISLQPLSLEHKTGVSLTAGVGRLELH
jgi:hypothetical protein